MINVCFSDYVFPLMYFLDDITAVRLFKFAYIVFGPRPCSPLAFIL